MTQYEHMDDILRLLKQHILTFRADMHDYNSTLPNKSNDDLYQLFVKSALYETRTLLDHKIYLTTNELLEFFQHHQPSIDKIYKLLHFWKKAKTQPYEGF